MTFNKLKNFLKPSKLKLFISAVFLVLCYLAIVQSWVFCQECSPKPFLYDFIDKIPIWPFVMYIVLPVTMILSLFGLEFLNLPVVLIYVYLLACIIDLLFRAAKK
ncbi:MAG: hypothetical protein AABW72_04560 [archaeon]